MKLQYQFRASSTVSDEVQYVTVSTDEAEVDDIKTTLENQIGNVKLELVGRNDGSGWEAVH